MLSAHPKTCCSRGSLPSSCLKQEARKRARAAPAPERSGADPGLRNDPLHNDELNYCSISCRNSVQFLLQPLLTQVINRTAMSRNCAVLGWVPGSRGLRSAHTFHPGSDAHKDRARRSWTGRVSEGSHTPPSTVHCGQSHFPWAAGLDNASFTPRL